MDLARQLRRLGTEIGVSDVRGFNMGIPASLFRGVKLTNEDFENKLRQNHSPEELLTGSKNEHARGCNHQVSVSR